jgi:hypothetical protein
MAGGGEEGGMSGERGSGSGCSAKSGTSRRPPSSQMIA